MDCGAGANEHLRSRERSAMTAPKDGRAGAATVPMPASQSTVDSKGRHYCASGYQMVDSVNIRNFRSFSDVKIDGCRRINIIVGENGSGKTALLEALFLAAGVSPELANWVQVYYLYRTLTRCRYIIYIWC